VNRVSVRKITRQHDGILSWMFPPDRPWIVQLDGQEVTQGKTWAHAIWYANMLATHQHLPYMHAPTLATRDQLETETTP
jgi:hypothetical protein